MKCACPICTMTIAGNTPTHSKSSPAIVTSVPTKPRMSDPRTQLPRHLPAEAQDLAELEALLEVVGEFGAHGGHVAGDGQEEEERDPDQDRAADTAQAEEGARGGSVARGRRRPQGRRDAAEVQADTAHSRDHEHREPPHQAGDEALEPDADELAEVVEIEVEAGHGRIDAAHGLAHHQ